MAKLAARPATKKISAFTLKVNGKLRTVKVASDTPLLWVIRDSLGLTGTKYGCGMGVCGACKVLLSGTATPSCVIPIMAATALDITTIESIEGRVADAVKTAWVERSVAQCGYCQSGQVMAAVGLLNANKNPSDKDIDTAMAGNICRCATYSRIRSAIQLAAKRLSNASTAT